MELNVILDFLNVQFFKIYFEFLYHLSHAAHTIVNSVKFRGKVTIIRWKCSKLSIPIQQFGACHHGDLWSLGPYK